MRARATHFRAREFHLKKRKSWQRERARIVTPGARGDFAKSRTRKNASARFSFSGRIIVVSVWCVIVKNRLWGCYYRVCCKLAALFCNWSARAFALLQNLGRMESGLVRIMGSRVNCSEVLRDIMVFFTLSKCV